MCSIHEQKYVMHRFVSEIKTKHFEVSTYCQECLE